MKLYNTLSRKIEDFKPTDPGEIRMYSCGPTVYDHAHIGNLSSYIYADTLRRVLQTCGHHVQHVMNLTDVEDKIIRRSRERYPDETPKEALRKLTSEYGQLFFDDMEAIGSDTSAFKFIWATKSIEAMRALITDLYNDGFAYIADGSVYFSIAKYKTSGKKYGQLLKLDSENTSQARIDNDEYDKESVHDFVLWKGKKPNEPAWEFDLDGQDLTGRPGWHIECSAMSVAKLGQPFDIHTGGVDLIFPHHENEIAQSTAGGGEIYATYFFHNEHLLVDGKKMSKSLNNFYTLEDVVKKGYEPLAFRLMVLQSHYRSQSNFTWENLDAAQNRLKRWRSVADLRWQDDKGIDSIEGGYDQKILDALQNDLDTPKTLEIIEEAFSKLENLHLCRGCEELILDSIENGLGIELRGDDIKPGQKTILSKRQKARDSHDFAESDKLRDELQKQGIGVRDTEQGQVWFRL